MYVDRAKRTFVYKQFLNGNCPFFPLLFGARNGNFPRTFFCHHKRSLRSRSALTVNIIFKPTIDLKNQTLIMSLLLTPRFLLFLLPAILCAPNPVPGPLPLPKALALAQPLPQQEGSDGTSKCSASRSRSFFENTLNPCFQRVHDRLVREAARFRISTVAMNAKKNCSQDSSNIQTKGELWNFLCQRTSGRMSFAFIKCFAGTLANKTFPTPAQMRGRVGQHLLQQQRGHQGHDQPAGYRV